jgi:hypothetical protein
VRGLWLTLALLTLLGGTITACVPLKTIHDAAKDGVLR